MPRGERRELSDPNASYSSIAQTPCVLCGSDDIEELSRRARDGRRHRTTICRRCGLVWANPPPTQSVVRTYYSEEYRRDYKGTPTRTLPQIYHAGRGAIARYRGIEHLLTKDDAILDVGCGGGERVYLLRRLGYNASGIEPDRTFSEAARSALGLPVKTGFVQDFEFRERAFRVILLYHVLEHIDHPARDPRAPPEMAVGRWGVAGGGAEHRSAVRSADHQISRGASFYFSPDTLAAMAASAGLAVVDMRLSEDGGMIYWPLPPADG